MKTTEPQDKKKSPTPRKWREDLHRVRRDMAKLEALYVQITGTSPPV